MNSVDIVMGIVAGMTDEEKSELLGRINSSITDKGGGGSYTSPLYFWCKHVGKVHFPCNTARQIEDGKGGNGFVRPSMVGMLDEGSLVLIGSKGGGEKTYYLCKVDKGSEVHVSFGGVDSSVKDVAYILSSSDLNAIGAIASDMLEDMEETAGDTTEVLPSGLVVKTTRVTV